MRTSVRLGLLLLSALAACREEAPPPARALTPREKDRAELVLQSRRGWTSEDAPRKLSLLLIAEKSKVRKGEGFRYRLEIKNVGRDPVVIQEAAPSFIKDGSLCAARGFRFLASPPGGAERVLPCEPAPAPAVSTAAASVPPSGLDLTLASGDYLLTRPESPASRFRPLRTRFRFDRLGTYRLRAAYAAKGLRAESNAVEMTVVP